MIDPERLANAYQAQVSSIYDVNNPSLSEAILRADDAFRAKQNKGPWIEHTGEHFSDQEPPLPEGVTFEKCTLEDRYCNKHGDWLGIRAFTASQIVGIGKHALWKERQAEKQQMAPPVVTEEMLEAAMRSYAKPRGSQEADLRGAIAADDALRAKRETPDTEPKLPDLWTVVNEGDYEKVHPTQGCIDAVSELTGADTLEAIAKHIRWRERQAEKQKAQPAVTREMVHEAMKQAWRTEKEAAQFIADHINDALATQQRNSFPHTNTNTNKE